MSLMRKWDGYPDFYVVIGIDTVIQVLRIDCGDCYVLLPLHYCADGAVESRYPPGNDKQVP